MDYEKELAFRKLVDHNKDFSKENILKLMNEAKDILSRDQETRHLCLDTLLVQFIRGLGYTEIADVYDDDNKWYA